jgi:hypothetical protein
MESVVWTMKELSMVSTLCWAGSAPILKHRRSLIISNGIYPNVRIYSLPEGQRYPNDKADWHHLLVRQNAVIDYLVPQGQPIQFVWNWLGRDSHIFKSYDLVRLGVFCDVRAETEYESWLLNDRWASGAFNIFLTLIADEAMRAFIIAPDCLIAPYDGGMDVILKDPNTAHAFKRHFADWVSPREDGC